jgi:hypothetical protein
MVDQLKPRPGDAASNKDYESPPLWSGSGQGTKTVTLAVPSKGIDVRFDCSGSGGVSLSNGKDRAIVSTDQCLQGAGIYGTLISADKLADNVLEVSAPSDTKWNLVVWTKR